MNDYGQNIALRNIKVLDPYHHAEVEDAIHALLARISELEADNLKWQDESLKNLIRAGEAEAERDARQEDARLYNVARKEALAERDAYASVASEVHEAKL